MAFPVFLDTCVLFGQYLCDTLLSLAEQKTFVPYWSEEVLEAVQRNVTARRPDLDPTAISRRLALMRLAFPEAMVTGYEHLIPAMTNDPGDHHVLAACIVSEAKTLVTFNLKDFPRGSLAPYDIKAVHPDTFLLDQLDLHPIWTTQAIDTMLARNHHPPYDWAALADVLGRSGVPRFANELRARHAARPT